MARSQRYHTQSGPDVWFLMASTSNVVLYPRLLVAFRGGVLWKGRKEEEEETLNQRGYHRTLSYEDFEFNYVRWFTRKHTVRCHFFIFGGFRSETRQQGESNWRRGVISSDKASLFKTLSSTSNISVFIRESLRIGRYARPLHAFNPSWYKNMPNFLLPRLCSLLLQDRCDDILSEFDPLAVYVTHLSNNLTTLAWPPGYFFHQYLTTEGKKEPTELVT